MGERISFPRVIGHRGAAARAPENTLAGFRRAAELGCRWVEFDARLSLDDRAVVIHDSRLERTTDGSGLVGATLYDDLVARDAGAFFAPDYKGERIPSLVETLALLRKRGLAFNLEMKAEAGRESALAEIVARTLAENWPREAPVPLVSSFETAALEAIAHFAPHLPRAYLVDKLSSAWRSEVERLGAIAVVCNHRALSSDGARAVKAAGFPLLAYTVNHPQRAETLFGWGVDGVISDAPDSILAIA